MTDSTVIFAYRLAWCFVVSLIVALFWAKRVATQATLVQDYTGRSMTTFKVDRSEFRRTWALWTFSLSGVCLLVLLMLETREWMMSAGYVG